MESKKKFTILVIALVSAIVISLATMIIVLVTGGQRATSSVNITYTATDVYVRLSAKAYVGTQSPYVFRVGGDPAGAETLSLDPTTTNGSLSQTVSEIALSKENPYIVFEYKFENLGQEIDAYIHLNIDNLTVNNFVLGYYIPEGHDALTDFSDIQDKMLPSYPTEGVLLASYADSTRNVKYVYIIASIESKMGGANLTGSFHWSLGKTQAVTLLLESEGAQLGANYDGTKYFVNSKIYEPQWEDINNKRFNGWYTSETTQNDSTRVQFPLILSKDTTLYPNYQDGNVPADYYFLNEDGTGYDVIYYSNNYDEDYNQIQQTALPTDTLIVPDVYNGSNGAKKVTNIIVEGYGAGPELWGIASNKIYLGNYVESANYIGMKYMYKARPETASPTTFVEVGRYTTTLSDCFINCPNLTTVRLFDKVTTLYAYYSDGSEESVGGYYGECESVLNSGLVGSPVYNNNSVLQAYNNSEYDILIKVSSGITNTNQISNWDSIECVAGGLFADYSLTGYVDWSYVGEWSSTLTTATIPSAMTTISHNLFKGCINLSSVTIHNNIGSIGHDAFYSCTSLTSITIPSSVTSIDYYAFFGCSGLTSITIPNSVTSIGSDAFRSCSGLQSVVIGNGVTSIGAFAFSGCSGLTSITIPNSVTSIGNYAFYSCTSLTSVTFKDTTTWQKASNDSFTSNVSNVDVSNPTQNATWLKSTSGYYNYYWRKI